MQIRLDDLPATKLGGNRRSHVAVQKAPFRPLTSTGFQTEILQDTTH